MGLKDEIRAAQVNAGEQAVIARRRRMAGKPALITDTQRLDWLEKEANEKGGILLHDGTETGRSGLGLRPGFVVRDLRAAIDAAMTPNLKSPLLATLYNPSKGCI